MAYSNGNGSRTSAELEREVSEQRNRIEARIGEIKHRLSPGQLLDEALSYSKHGGEQFASNLGQQISANPLPAALVGIGLAWLMAGNMSGGARPGAVARPPQPLREEYPYAIVPSGGLTRTSHATDETGAWWSEFRTDAGATFKAPADELGNRAGHFVDQSGKTFAGFIDAAGNRVRQFQDQSGEALDDALGWANHGWQDAREAVGQVVQNVASGASRLGENLASGTRRLGSVGDTMQSQADQLSRQITSLYRQQPLIAGALAFAVGAAVGATLPHTDEEDQWLGKEADRIRGEAGQAAGNLYSQSKKEASEAYEDATDRVGQMYKETKERVANIAGGSGAPTSMSKH